MFIRQPVFPFSDRKLIRNKHKQLPFNLEFKLSPEDQGYAFGGSRWEAQPYSGRLSCPVRSQARRGRGSKSPLPAEDLRFSEMNAFLL